MNTLLNKFRHIKSSKRAIGGLFVLAVMALGFGSLYIGQQNQANAAGDCSANSIVRCGVGHYGDITRVYDENHQGDLRAIYDHYWIKREVAAGDRVVQGVTNNRGEVIAEGRVVARNASSIGRQKQAASRQISIAGKTYYETTHVGGAAFRQGISELGAIVVLDANGSFKYAVMNVCGNPIFSPEPVRNTPPKPPVTPPAPQPKKQSVARCDALSVQAIDRTKFQFVANHYVENATISKVTFVVRDAQGKEVKREESTSNKFEFTQTAAGKYTVEAILTAKIDGKEQEITAANCKKQFEVVEEGKAKVCEISTKTWKEVTKKEAEDTKKYSTKQEDCEEKKVRVCEISTKTWGKEVTEREAQDKSKYSTNEADCKQAPVSQGALPTTGPAGIIGGTVGLAAIGLAGYYYYTSRRNG